MKSKFFYFLKNANIFFIELKFVTSSVTNFFFSSYDLQDSQNHAQYTEKNRCLELISRFLTIGQPSYMFSCNI